MSKITIEKIIITNLQSLLILLVAELEQEIILAPASLFVIKSVNSVRQPQLNS